MKFIHTSDWHKGRQFHNVSLLEDQQNVLNQLIDYSEKDFVDADALVKRFELRTSKEYISLLLVSTGTKVLCQH